MAIANPAESEINELKIKPSHYEQEKKKFSKVLNEYTCK